MTTELCSAHIHNMNKGNLSGPFPWLVGGAGKDPRNKVGTKALLIQDVSGAYTSLSVNTD